MKLSYAMTEALKLVREDGYTPKQAALQANVSMQGLYRNLRKWKPRCAHCGAIVADSQSPNSGA